MEKNQLIFAIVFISALLFIIAFFFWLVLITQRNRANNLLQEKLLMQQLFEKQQLESRLEIQEEIFSQISRELHDNVGQILSVAKIQLNHFLDHKLDDLTLISQASESISFALVDLRDIAKGLDSERLQTVTLANAIERECMRIKRIGIIQIENRVFGEERNIKPSSKVILFRSVQESLQNILKHSKASRAEVNMTYDKEFVELVIQDNGVGFAANNIQNQTGGAGLKNIVNRCEYLKGVAKIRSTENEGTIIQIVVPYE